MAAPTVINVGGFAPSQVTVTNPGDYTVAVSLLATNPEVTFQGPGAYNLLSVVSALTATTFEATDGATLTISGLAGAGSTTDLVVDSTSTIAISSAVGADNPINAQFLGNGGTLTFAAGLLNLLTPSPTVLDFGPMDHIDFGAPVSPGDIIVYVPNVGDTGGALTLETSTGSVVGTVNLLGSYTLADFTLGADGIDFACFLRGTHVLTSQGEVLVEALRAGDLVATLSNGFVPVRAVRTRSFTKAEAGADKVRPVRIGVGALGNNVPHRDLYVSPDHSMFLDGVLVPAQLLLNGQTITQPPRPMAIDYIHVEVEPHDIIIAEGAASESYLDIGNQGHFGKPGVISLFPASEPKTWEDACAPLVLGGPKLAAIRATLAAHAAELAGHAVLMRVA